MEKIAIVDQRFLGDILLDPKQLKDLEKIITPPTGTFNFILGDLEGVIRAAAEAEYDGVGLISTEIDKYLEQHSSEEMVSLLEQYHIPVSEICCIVEWSYDEEGRKKAMELARRTFSYASLLRCKVVDLGLPPHGGNMSLAVKEFREICDVAAGYGLSIALEIFGFGTHITDIKKARLVVEGPANGGINLDTSQFYRGNSTLEDLEDFPVKKIFTAHFCDFPRQWNAPGDCWDRPLPGEGVAPIKEIVSILKDNGYRGYYTLEAFNYELWSKDPGEVARIGKNVMEDLLSGNM